MQFQKFIAENYPLDFRQHVQNDIALVVKESDNHGLRHCLQTLDQLVSDQKHCLSDQLFAMFIGSKPGALLPEPFDGIHLEPTNPLVMSGPFLLNDFANRTENPDAKDAAIRLRNLINISILDYGTDEVKADGLSY